MDEPVAKKLDKRTIHQLFKAADFLVLTELRKNTRPRRNRAILALLYYTGLRVSELCGLRREQYAGKYLERLKRKGHKHQSVYLNTACRAALDEERQRDGSDEDLEPLFVSTRRGRLNRSQLNRIIDHIAQEANKHRKNDEKIEIHPHQLRRDRPSP